MKVIVTGASKGIGRGIARVLAREGHQLGLLARSLNLLGELRDEIRSGGGICEIAACDLRNHDETSRSIQALTEALGGLDALINNAGLVIRKDVLSISLDEWHAMIETNVNGVFYATRAALPYLRESQNAHLINISSISGKVPLPGGSGYAASKYAVTGFSDSLFQELRDYGIKVCSVYPGSVDSDSHRHDPSEDHSWKVKPEDVGIACRDLMNASGPACISHLEIRPLRRPPKK